MTDEILRGELEEPTENVEIWGAPTDEPDAPDELPAYLLDAVDRQGADDLRELAHYALERAAWLSREIDTDELADDGEEIVDVDQADGSGGYIVEKKIPCGKDACSQCPHGPYKYRQWRDGEKIRSEYLGKA